MTKPKQMNKPNLLISFSGGETSAYMTMLILEKFRDDWNDILVVFANTSKENEETLEFVRQCDKHFGFNTVWIEPKFSSTRRIGWKVVDFQTAARKGEVFEAMIKAYGMSNYAYPHCTRELKTRPIRAYTKTIIGSRYYTSIGIRSDEFDRVASNYKEQRFYYPLVELGITKNHVNAFWRSQPFRLNLKGFEGNCDLCWKKSLRKQMTIIRNNPKKAEWWIDIEKKYGGYIPDHSNRSSLKPPGTWKPKNSMQQIVNMAQTYAFSDAYDDSQNGNYQIDMFRTHIDKNYGCEESCEPF